MLRIVMFFLLLPTSFSYADVALVGSFFASNENTSEGDKFNLITDLRFGYEFDLPKAEHKIGVLFVIENQKGSGDEFGQDQSGLGLSVVYRASDFYFMFAYMFDVEDESSGLNSSLSGDGFKFDVGYGWRITKNTRIGPRISYRNYDFDDGFSFNKFEPLFSAYTVF